MIYVILQFNSQVSETRQLANPQLPFEYCYGLRSSIFGEKLIPILF